MIKTNRFTLNHNVLDYEDGTNEVLILEPSTDKVAGDILFLHGHQVGARVGAWEVPRYLGPLLSRGYRIIAPSLLGYGKTSGEPDYCGPLTLKRLEATIRDFVDGPVHVMGASRGGTLAVLFAEHFSELAASCTAIAGVYDLESMVNQTSDERMKQNIINETGGTVDSYNKRDPKKLCDKLKAPLHIVHGLKDEQIPVSQAEDFSLFLQEKNINQKLTILEKSGHKLFSERIFKEVMIPFLETE